MIRDLLAVLAGGALGAGMRWGTGLVLSFPLATLAVNVVGSFAIGVVWAAVGARWHPFLMGGVLGGFTTFSAFSLDLLRMAESGRIGAVLAHGALSVGLPLVAVWLGVAAGRGWS
ncbi:MAG: CrcB family protein [Rubellimicrobium sp.]|nr:CrcB family protein [Rubellimicrobium sp.]